jgi:beta-glucosidase
MPTAFPDDFLWGTATSSYQIEGAVDEDGRGPSIWDTFTHTPGTIEDGSTGDVACDHYHRWREDVQLMADLGVDAYRFSIAWPRILPEGTGTVNEPGLDFYDRLVDGLLDAGITPFVTLYHWDLPQALQDQGGWADRAIVPAFAAYAETVAKRLGDRVTHWITHNEPWVVAFLGHYFGEHAPGEQDLTTALQVAHHLLVSHGQATQALRASADDPQVGITLNLTSARPAHDPDTDAAAVRRADGFQNRWFLDPVYGRGYPDDLVAHYGDRMPAMEDGDLDLAAVPTDFLGVNYYRPQWVEPAPDDPLGFASLGPETLADRGYTITEMGWPVDPSGLRDLLSRLDADYPVEAIYITENGAAFPDTVEDGTVDDPQRIAYYQGHLEATADAIADGAPLDGYFAWSLLDNFEWAFGYTKRFGLVYVDYDTQARIPKASARWYRDVIDANALPE